MSHLQTLSPELLPNDNHHVPSAAVDALLASREELNLTNLRRTREFIDNYFEITFFVPCRNEEAAILATLVKIKKVAEEVGISYEILIYDDASTDKTLDLVAYFHKQNPEVPLRLFARPKRKGLGYNYFAGAYEGYGKHYMMVCGDNSETEKSMHQLLSRRGKAEMIIPYFAELDSRTGFRRYLSRIFTILVNGIGGFNLRYYNGTVLHFRKNICRWAPISSGFAYQAELLSILLSEDKSYEQIQIDNNDRVVGFSRAFTFMNILSISHSLSQIFLRRMRRILFPDAS